MKYFVMYMLKCNDGSYYIGHTDDLDKRMSEHNLGSYEGYTSARRPVELKVRANPSIHFASHETCFAKHSGRAGTDKHGLFLDYSYLVKIN